MHPDKIMPTLMRKWSVLSLIFPQAKSNQAYIEVAHYYLIKELPQALQWFQK
jgi:hypothetical protein